MSKNPTKFCCYLLCIISLTLYHLNTYSQISGTKTICPSGCDFTGIGSAVTALQTQGISGPVILELDPTYISTSETLPLTFSGLATSSVKTIIIRPKNAVASALSITGSNATAIVDLNGVTYLTIDGRPGGTGTAKMLNVENTDVAGATIRFINDASMNTLKHLAIKGVETSATNGVVLFSTTAGTTGNDNNTISNCNIGDGASKPANGIFALGSTGAVNNNNSISGCSIYNFFTSSGTSCGVSVSTNNSDWIISNNHFYQLSSLVPTGNIVQYGIFINDPSGINFNVTGNYIGGGAASASGNAWSIASGSNNNRFVGIQITAGNTTTSGVQGNTIANFAWNTNSGYTIMPGNWSGIVVWNSGSVNIGTVTGNVIGSNTGTASITLGQNFGGIHCGIASNSPDPVNISNNAIGSITTVPLTSGRAGGNVIGIQTTGSLADVTINNNIIGSTTTANSITIGFSTSVTIQRLSGIENTSAGRVDIKNNIIANMINNYSGSATSAASLRGISSTAGVGTVTGNTIYNLVNSAPGSGVNTSAGTIGIMYTSSTSTGTMGNIISGNKIYSISNTAASGTVNVYGIYFTSHSLVMHSIARNLVYNINVSSSNANAILRGIFITGGTTNYQNNLVRLGINDAGTAIVTGMSIGGIYEQGGTSNFYNNSVYVGGAGVSGTLATYAFYSSVSGSSRNYINNIFVNARSNGSGTGTHYAIAVGGVAPGPVGLNVNYNIYNAPGTGGMLGLLNSASYSSLPTWRVATNGDAYSIVGDPGFVNATGDAATVDLHLASPTAAEGSGTNLPSITDDFDGVARSGLTPNDIGADAGNFTNTDNFAPVISYPATGNASGITNRILNNITITDIGSGVPVSGTSKPYIWFRRSLPVASAWASNAGTLSTGTGNSGSWSFTIDYSLLALTPVLGETYEYYIVAQDQATALNIGYNPSVGAAHTSVTAQSTAPATPTSYIIQTGLSTSIDIGLGQTYTSLTGAGGLFNAINTNVLTGNTIINVTSDLAEDGTTALNLPGLGGYTLTIQPDAAIVRVISNTAVLSNAMIRLNGAAGVTFDGRFSGAGQYLRIVNTHTTATSCQPAISLLGSVNNILVRNCIIESNASTATLGTVLLGAGANTGITITADDIRDAQGSPGTAGIPYNAIYSGSGSNISLPTIQSNNIYNFSNYGINLPNVADGCTISGNSIYYNNATASTAPQAGISVGAGIGHTITGNYIGGQSPNCGGTAWINNAFSTYPAFTFAGILLNTGNSAASTVSGNTVQNVSLTNTGSANLYGIFAGGGNVTISGNTLGHPTTANSLMNAGNAASTVTCGIMNNSTSLVSMTNNTIANFKHTGTTVNIGQRGISQIGTGTASITGNTIYNLSSDAITNVSTTAPGVGILVNAGTAHFIENNLIYNISNTAASAGTFVVGVAVTASTTGTISRNRIYGLSLVSTNTAAGIIGININGGSWSVGNNQVSLSNGANTNSIIVRGLWDNAGSAKGNYYYNSIYIGGSIASGANNSYGYYRTTGSSSTTLRNNIFFNERTGGTGINYATGNNITGSGWTSASSNHNLYVVTDLTKAADWIGTTQTFDQWKTSSISDTSSYIITNASVTAANLFADVSNGNLNINNSNTAAWYINGKGIANGVTTDFSGSPLRAATVGISTDIGSNEINVTGGIEPPLLTESAAPALNTTTTYSFAGRKIAEISWGSTGSLPSIAAKYFSGTAPGGITQWPVFGNSTSQIIATGGSGFTYAIKLYVTEAERHGISDADIILIKKDGAGPWVKLDGITSVDNGGKYLTAGALTSFSEFSVAQQEFALHLRVVSFTGNLQENKTIMLAWKVDEQVDIRNYTVEKSADGLHFTPISTQPVYAALSAKYSFTDNNPLQGANYYRLKITETSSRVLYSAIVKILAQKYARVFLTPVPARSYITVQLADDSWNGKMVSVYNLSGHRVKQHILSSGNSIYIQDLPSGMYLLRLPDGELLKFVKE